MSQPTTSVDSMSMMDQESFTQAQLDQLFHTVGTDTTDLSSNTSEASGDLDFKFDDSYFVPTDSSAPSSAPTPYFVDYSFGQPSSEYHTPGPNTPHPYPIEQQQCFNPSPANSLPFRPRPQPTRSQTSSFYPHSSHSPSHYTRRRSLSQGDADRIATANIRAPNPTFLRLQAPRTRSSTPDDEHRRKRRAGPYKHTHSTSQDLNNRGYQARGNTPTSTPLNPTLVGGMIPTSIGTPLSPMDCSNLSFRRTAAHQRMPTYHENVGLEDTVFKQMTRPDQLEQSRKIIEIGAMAVRAPLNPRWQESGKVGLEQVLKKLEEVEQYLKSEGGECDQALEGCGLIREALTRKLSIIGGEDETKKFKEVQNVGDWFDVPSTMLSTQDSGLFSNGADNDSLMAIFIQENGSCHSDDKL